jgi:poly(3-hydroxybutyrate) depolymerase
MKARLCCSILVAGCLLALLSAGWTQVGNSGSLPQGFQRLEFKVDSVTREALVYVVPMAKTTFVPVVFVFHGHGGNSR